MLSLLEDTIAVALAKSLSIELLIKLLQRSEHCSTVSVATPPSSCPLPYNTEQEWKLFVTLSLVTKTETPQR